MVKNKLHDKHDRCGGKRFPSADRFNPCKLNADAEIRLDPIILAALPI